MTGQPKARSEGALRRALAEAGYGGGNLPLRPEFRHWRWLAQLPNGRIAFFADYPEAMERLARERALLDLLGRRVRFAVPVVEHASPDGSLQVRRMVEGVASLGGGGRERALAALPTGRRLADELGRAFADLHGSVTPKEAAALGLPTRGPFPPAANLRRRSGRLPDPALEPVLDAVLDRYASIGEEMAGCVLTHGDPWVGNFAIDPEQGRLMGMFDFEDAAWADRHADFRYLHSFGDDYAERVLDAYSAASGAQVSLQRTALFHVLAAFEALAEAEGDGVKAVGRLHWVRDALARAPGRLLGLQAAAGA